jgi:predicted transcriptional regulator
VNRSADNPSLDSIRVRDVMTQDVVTVQVDMPLNDLVRLLDFEQIGGAPVVDRAGRLLGVASATDVMRESAGLPASFEAASLNVRDVMTPATFTVRPDATLRELARFLVRGGVHRALVLEDERLIGVVTAFDVVRAIAGEDGRQPPAA